MIDGLDDTDCAGRVVAGFADCIVDRFGGLASSTRRGAAAGGGVGAVSAVIGCVSESAALANGVARIAPFHHRPAGITGDSATGESCIHYGSANTDSADA